LAPRLVKFADFNHGAMETPMTDTTFPPIELPREQDDWDFLRSVAEAVLQLLIEHDVEGAHEECAFRFHVWRRVWH
jgi:hypothetical protein